jgi:hypothetical protein
VREIPADYRFFSALAVETLLLRKRLTARANHQGVLKAIEALRLEALAKRWAKDGATATPV